MEPLILSNIVLGGGNTKIPGFGTRLKNEIENAGRLSDLTSSVNIHETETNAQPDAAWRGLNLFAPRS